MNSCHGSDLAPTNKVRYQIKLAQVADSGELSLMPTLLTLMEVAVDVGDPKPRML